MITGRYSVHEWKNVSFEFYGSIPIAFQVESVYELCDDPLDSLDVTFKLSPVGKTYTKQYDLPDNRPCDWPKQWDLTNWGFMAASDGKTIIGCAAIAWKTPALDMLENRDDIAVLWDLRVAPKYRRHGVGKALFHAAKRWSSDRNVRIMKIETQSNNVPACRFYEAHGCRIYAIKKDAYPKFPDEIQLLWKIDL